MDPKRAALPFSTSSSTAIPASMCCDPETASAMSSCPTKTSSTSSASVARIDFFRPGSRSHSTQLSSRVQSWAVATNDFTRPLVERLGAARGIRVRAMQAASAKATDAIG